MFLRILGYLMAVILIFAVVIWLYVRFQEKWGIFHPSGYERTWFEQVSQFSEELEPVEFEAGDGVNLTGIWRAGRERSPAIIFFHGNAGNITSRLWWFELVVPEGWSALLFDYRGYGLSAGKPGEEGLYKDVEGAVNYVRGRQEGKIYLHGKSLGTVMAARGTRESEVAGVILESGFPDAVSMAHTILPLPGIRYFMTVRLELVKYIRQAERQHGNFSKLVVHGTKDRIVPFHLGKQLYRQLSVPKEKWFIEGAGHNDLVEVAGEAEYSRRIRQFLKD